MILQWARHNVADLNVFCPAFPPLYQWWKWMIIAERGLGLLLLAQSSQAITQPKCTYPKNLTRHLEPNPNSSHVSQPPPNINYYIFVWIKFPKTIQMRGNSKGRGPTQLPITFIRHSKKSTDDQHFISSWSRKKINIWCAALKRGG